LKRQRILSGNVLEPLKTFFCDRDLYGLVIARRELNPNYTPEERFFEQVARGSGGNTLMLMPITGQEPIRILDPFPPLQTLAEFPVPLPAVIYWTYSRKGKDHPVPPEVCAVCRWLARTPFRTQFATTPIYL